MNHSSNAGWLLTILRTLERSGIDGEALLAAEEMSIDDLLDGTRRLSITTMTRIWRRVRTITKNPAIGLEISKHICSTSFGPLSAAIYAAPDLITGLQVLAQYGNVWSNAASYWVRPRDEDIELVSVTRERLADESIDCGFAAFLQIMRDVSTPDFTPLAVQLGRQKPKDPTPWYRHFGSQVHFDAEGQSIFRFSKSSLTQRLYGHNAAVFEACVNLMDAQLASLRRGPVTSFIRTQIVLSLRHDSATIEEVAKVMGIAVRTVQRQLRLEQQSFSDLVEDVRQEYAKQYLERTKLSVTEISHKLGYANASSFTRACRRWFGAPPISIRRQVEEVGESWHESIVY